MRQGVLVVLCIFFILALAGTAVASERRVTFTFTELWLDDDDVYEEEGSVYADGYLVVEAEQLPELTLLSFPLFGSGGDGTLKINSLELNYLSEERLAELDPGGDYGFDEQCTELTAHISLDRAAVAAVLGLDPAALKADWALQSEAIIAHYVDMVYEAYYNSGADLAYGDDLCLSIEDGGLVAVELSAAGDGGADLEIQVVSWGLDALAGMLFERWTNVGYWFYDLFLSGEIGSTGSALNFEAAVSYLLYEYYYPYPDNYTCWIWEGYSLLPPSPEALNFLGLEEGYLDYAADYEGIPRAWKLAEGETVNFQIPDGWHPKTWWEPYGPAQKAGSDEPDLSAARVHFSWENNQLFFPGPMDMESWSERFNSIYWEEAGGLPGGLPYVELSPGVHYFISRKGLIIGLMSVLFILAVGGLIHAIIATIRIPQRLA